MLIERDIAARLKKEKGFYAQILIGPRQCGKSTLFSLLAAGKMDEVTFDDFQMRKLAQNDPALFFSQFSPPLILDEVQYAPQLFPEIKKRIDILKKERLFSGNTETIETQFYITGSNQILLDKEVKETLVGRASYYHLNTLTVHEILKALPKTSINEILFKGGWPELYTNSLLNPVQYLNDYIRNYIEKDIFSSAGIIKKREFHTVLGMLAARTANLLNHSALAKDSGVKSVTIHEWVSILERTSLLYLLQPFETNLNKRLTKSPKVYFLDSGLSCRLQGWIDPYPLLNSPQAGALFETLVLAEIIKCINNFGKNWKLALWRTKEGEEIDFLIETEDGTLLALDAKLSIHGADPIPLPASFAKTFPEVKELILVTFGGKKMRLSKSCIQIPLAELTEFLTCKSF